MGKFSVPMEYKLMGNLFLMLGESTKSLKKKILKCFEYPKFLFIILNLPPNVEFVDKVFDFVSQRFWRETSKHNYVRSTGINKSHKVYEYVKLMETDLTHITKVH